MMIPPAPQAPPHCPNPACKYHRDNAGWHWVRDGFFARLASPHRVQRFRCRHCRRRFSAQTFRVSYWLKRPGLVIPVLHGLVACSALRQLARSLTASPQTILLHANRLGRHCLLFHDRTRPRGAHSEPLALDGFISFEYSQFHPTAYHVLTGTESHFTHGFTVSELRRSGSMTPAQKRTRRLLEDRHGRPDPRATEQDVTALLRIAAPAPQALELRSDEHTDYPRALRQLTHLKVTHVTISSRAARTPMNPLFAINLLDLLIRHSSANHKRETIAFAKRRQMASYRLWVFLVWRNWLKWVSEQKHEDTPAMRAGLTDHRLEPPELLKRRLFVTHATLPRPWHRQYWARLVTRLMPEGRPHRLRYAF